MFYLKKCAHEGCTRSGFVSLKEGSKYCNLHEKRIKRDKKGKFIKE